MSVVMRSRRAVTALGGSALVAAGVLAAGAGPASATVLGCGSTVSSSVTLTANINCTTDSSDNALTITAPGVTVNLNGHSILGPGVSADTRAVVDTGGGAGGYSDVTVENGTITDFAYGIDIEGASGDDLTGAVVRHVTVNQSTPAEPQNESIGVLGEYLEGASIQNVTTVHLVVGVELESSQDNTISRDHVTDAIAGGIGDFAGEGNTISGNTMTHAFNYGIDVDESAGDVIHGNTFTKFCDDGIAFYGASGLSVTGNTLDDCYMGIADDEENTGDTVSGNHGSGNYWGIYAADSTDETYTGNTFGGGQYGIETDCPVSETLTGNTTSHNSETGVYVYTEECDPSITYSATLSGNTADYNRFGLYSQIATTGAANHAAHNKAVNCYNVHCTRAATMAGPVVAPPHYQPVMPRLPFPARR